MIGRTDGRGVLIQLDGDDRERFLATAVHPIYHDGRWAKNVRFSGRTGLGDCPSLPTRFIPTDSASTPIGPLNATRIKGWQGQGPYVPKDMVRATGGAVCTI